MKNSKKLPVSIKIVGLILSESYQKCKLFAHKLRKYHNKKFSEPVIKGYLEMDWVEYLGKLRKDVGGQTWAVRKGVVVFLDAVFLGGEEELFTRFSLYVVDEPTQERIRSLAKHEYLNYMKEKNLLYTFFELSLDGQYMGSLLFELRSDLLPKTSVWFATVCDPGNQLGYSYKNSKIHRVCKSGWFQGGKLGLGAGAGFLEDESFCYKHDRRGVLSLANYGKDCNRVQFFVTFKPSQWMDKYYVAFGRVVEGSDVLRRLEYTKCTYEHPDHEIKVENCGLVGVGFARNLVIKTKMKGLTMGDPHIHLETFVDIVLERFEEILFERLDDEVKRKVKGDWIGQMLWDTVQPQIMAREPVPDVLDVKDISSRVFHPSTFIKGLYGLRDIPDHFIMELLDDIITDTVDVVDTRDMVSSIVNLIVNSLDLEVGKRDDLSNLVTNVNSIVFGHEGSKTMTPELSNMSKRDLFTSSVHKVASQTPTIRKLLTEYSTYSMSQASYAEEELGRVLSTHGGREVSEAGDQKLASTSTIRRLLTEYNTASVSQASVVEDGAGVPPARMSLSDGGASHASTVRKMMTEYKRFSVSTTSLSVVAAEKEGGGKRSTTRDSVIGFIWETLFKSFKV